MFFFTPVLYVSRWLNSINFLIIREGKGRETIFLHVACLPDILMYWTCIRSFTVHCMTATYESQIFLVLLHHGQWHSSVIDIEFQVLCLTWYVCELGGGGRRVGYSFVLTYMYMYHVLDSSLQFLNVLDVQVHSPKASRYKWLCWAPRGLLLCEKKTLVLSLLSLSLSPSLPLFPCSIFIYTNLIC